MACPSVIFGPGHVSRPTHVARCWRGHTCPYNARNCRWWHDEDGEGSACAATARAATPLPPASLLVRLSSLLEQIAEVLKVIAQELFQQRTVEPIVDEPVPLAEFVGVWEAIGEQIGAVPVPQITDDIGEVTQRVPERMHARVGEQIVDIAVPLILEKIVEMILLVPLERINDQIVEQIVAVLVPQVKEDIVEVTQPVLQERVQNRVGEQILGVPVPQIKEGLVDGVLVTGACAESFTRSVCGCASAPDHDQTWIPFSQCLLSVSKNESWSRFLWCPRPRRKSCLLFRPCLRSVSRASRGTDFCGATDHGENCGVPFSGKALGLQQVLQDQTLSSRCCDFICV